MKTHEAHAVRAALSAMAHRLSKRAQINTAGAANEAISNAFTAPGQSRATPMATATTPPTGAGPGPSATPGATPGAQPTAVAQMGGVAPSPGTFGNPPQPAMTRPRTA